MGKQICFFMSYNDDKLFLDFILKNTVKIIDSKGETLSLGETEQKKPIYSGEVLNEQPISDYFVSFPESKIVIKDNGFIDFIKSDIIEVMRSSTKKTNQLWNGRIWFETKYYDETGQIVKKPDWLNKKFNEYKKWITKNYRSNKDKDFYIGEDAYKMYKDKGFKMMNAPLVSIDFD